MELSALCRARRISSAVLPRRKDDPRRAHPAAPPATRSSSRSDDVKARLPDAPADSTTARLGVGLDGETHTADAVWPLRAFVRICQACSIARARVDKTGGAILNRQSRTMAMPFRRCRAPFLVIQSCQWVAIQVCRRLLGTSSRAGSTG